MLFYCKNGGLAKNSNKFLTNTPVEFLKCKMQSQTGVFLFC